MEGAKSAVKPAVKRTVTENEQDNALEGGKITQYRASASWANRLAADRLDCQHGAKEACRWTAEPTEMVLQALNDFESISWASPIRCGNSYVTNV